MWKFEDFSITQILREINFEESRSCKTVVFSISGALIFVNLVNFSLNKLQCVKMADFALQESSKLISRKNLSDRKMN